MFFDMCRFRGLDILDRFFAILYKGDGDILVCSPAAH